MRSTVLQRAAIFIAIAGLVPLGVLTFSFQQPLMGYLSRHGPRDLVFIRIACVLAQGAVVAVLLARRRLANLAERIDAHVHRFAATQAVAAPDFHAPVRHGLAAGIAAVVAVTLFGIAVTSPVAFREVIQEDHIVEYASSSLWLAAALCGVVALLVDRRRMPLKLAIYVPLIAFAILCGGEEISWGQRLFNVQGPAVLRALNKQGELNLHDIGSISVYANVFFAGAVFFLLAVPLLLARAPAWRAYLRSLNAPLIDPFVARVFGIGLVAWALAGLRFGTLGFSPLSLWGYYTQMDDEVFEFFAAFSFFTLIALDASHRLVFARRARTGGRAGAASS